MVGKKTKKHKHRPDFACSECMNKAADRTIKSLNKKKPRTLAVGFVVKSGLDYFNKKPYPAGERHIFVYNNTFGLGKKPIKVRIVEDK